jgi:hypothetical protein
MPEGAIYVGRPSRWGNDFEVGVDGTTEECVKLYAEAMAMLKENSPAYYNDLLAPLRGHDLACWCPLVDADGNPVPCHANVLLELCANLDKDEDQDATN